MIFYAAILLFLHLILNQKYEFFCTYLKVINTYLNRLPGNVSERIYVHNNLNSYTRAVNSGYEYLMSVLFWKQTDYIINFKQIML